MEATVQSGKRQRGGGSRSIEGRGSQSGRRGLENETGEIESDRKGVADDGGFGGVFKTEPGGALELTVGEGSITRLGIGLAADAQFPGRRIRRKITSEADAAIRQSKTDGDRETKWTLGVNKRTMQAGRKIGVEIRRGNIGDGLVGTFLTADPFGGLALVIMAVEGESVTELAKRDALLVIAAGEAGEGQVIAVVMTQADGADGLEFGVNEYENLIEALPGIAEKLTDLEGGEAGAQRFEAGNGQQMIIDVGRSAGSSQGPEQEETVIDDVECFGLVAKVMLAAGCSRLLCL